MMNGELCVTRCGMTLRPMWFAGNYFYLQVVRILPFYLVLIEVCLVSIVKVLAPCLHPNLDKERHQRNCTHYDQTLLSLLSCEPSIKGAWFRNGFF